jgi:hypothetical protein
MGHIANDGLVSVLRAEVQSARAEASAVRNSLRYRLGDALLGAFPISLKSFRVIPKVLVLLFTHRRNVRASAHGAGSAVEALPSESVQCSHVSYDPGGSHTSVDDGVWRTNTERLLLARLEAGPVKELVLHAVSEPIARRLARLQWQGCRIECLAEAGTPFADYAQGLAADSHTRRVS